MWAKKEKQVLAKGGNYFPSRFKNNQKSILILGVKSNSDKISV